MMIAGVREVVFVIYIPLLLFSVPDIFGYAQSSPAIYEQNKSALTGLIPWLQPVSFPDPNRSHSQASTCLIPRPQPVPFPVFNLSHSQTQHVPFPDLHQSFFASLSGHLDTKSSGRGLGTRLTVPQPKRPENTANSPTAKVMLRC